MINNYSEKAESENLETPLYFMDEDARSYCKLKVSSLVEVAKDDDENPVDFAKGGVDGTGSGKSGNIEIDADTIFKVSKSSISDSYEIICGDFSLKFSSDSYFAYGGNRYRVTVNADGIVSLCRYYVSGFDRFTTLRETAGTNGWCSIWEEYINKNLAPALTSVKADIKTIEAEMEAINEQCNIQKFVKRKSGELYDELSNYWIEGEYSNGNIAVHDSTTMSERIELAKELMRAGEVDLKKCSQPKFEMSVDAINFIKLYEFRQFTNELVLGRRITIEKEDGICFSPALMVMEYDLDSSENFSMTFSNAFKPSDTFMTFAELLKESSSTSRTVSANWSNLTDYSRNKEEITKLIEAPLDRSLRAMQSSLASQAFVVDENGILGRKYDLEADATKGMFSNEQIRIVNNTIVFTKDNWDTAALALGKTEFGYGLIADVVVGELLLSENVSIGSKSERVRIDDKGLLIKNDKGETILQADALGNLTLIGTVFAKDGEFTGIVHALDGEFNGVLKAVKGEIGGYEIGEKYLKSGKVGLSSSNDIDGEISFWAGEADATKAPFYVTNDGKLVAYDASISGIINANSGTIGGLIIGDNGISSGAGGLTFTKDGLIIAQQLEVNDYFKAKELQVGSVSGRNSGSASLNFESAGKQERQITASVGITVIDEGKDGFLSMGWEAGSANITVRTNAELLSPKTFTLNLDYVDPSDPDCSDVFTHTITLAKGQTSGSISVANKEKNRLGNIYTLRRATVSPTSYMEDTGVALQSISCNGSFSPANNSCQLGSVDARWGNIYAKTSEISDSDKKFKYDIKQFENAYSLFFDNLNPVSYKMKSGDSGRTHMGLLANEVRDAILNAGLSPANMACYCSWIDKNGVEGSGLRYGELISLCIYEIQKLKDEIKNLQLLSHKINLILEKE